MSDVAGVGMYCEFVVDGGEEVLIRDRCGVGATCVAARSRDARIELSNK